MSRSTLIKNVRLIDASRGPEGTDKITDIGFENGAVKFIGEPPSHFFSESCDVVDGTGKILFPGLIDVHVHLREPGQSHKETIATGTQAALRGGFTTVAVMANTLPVNDSPEITQWILDRAREANGARVEVIGAVTRGLKGEHLAELGLMRKAGARAFSDDGHPVMNSKLMRAAMGYAAMWDMPIISHAEDLNLSTGAPMNEGQVSALYGVRGQPNASEEIMVAREIALARDTGARIHIAHLSTREGLAQVRRARVDGVRVTCEVTPHHLLLTDLTVCHHSTDSKSCGLDSAHKMAPPLRSEADRQALLEGLAQGHIDMIASDHAPHGCLDKETAFEIAANGIIGLETTLPLMAQLVRDGVLSWMRLCDAMTVKPAKFLGLDRGSLGVGAVADATLFDPHAPVYLDPGHWASISKNSPFIQQKTLGRVMQVWVGGETKWQSP